MWRVRPATMTRRTERLSHDFGDYGLRLCRATLRLSHDFHDFRPNDFATFRRGSATLIELPISPRGRRLFLSLADRRRVSPGRRERCRGSGLIGKWKYFQLFILYSCRFAKNLDFLLYLRLTSKCKYAILYLPKGSKCKLNFERGLYYEKDF